MTRYERFLGAMFGLAYGDAISFPALFHRFQTMPRRRHNFLWRSNSELDEMGITRMMMPFTHRLEAHNLEIGPTDDTEWALLTLRALLAAGGRITPDTFLDIWRQEVLPVAGEVRSSFSERAAIENLKIGLTPPATGNDNPLHYEDCAVPRAVPVGLYCAGNPDQAAEMAEWDARITQAEDGIYAARGMAAAIALLVDGAPLEAAISRARQEFPPDSWIAHLDGIAQDCMRTASQPDELIILLTQKVVNTVYSYGSAAPETFPTALVIVTACNGDLRQSSWLANGIAKSADSVPAMVGALCGAFQGVDAISPMWRTALDEARGLCLPFLQGSSVETLTAQLAEQRAQ